MFGNSAPPPKTDTATYRSQIYTVIGSTLETRSPYYSSVLTRYTGPTPHTHTRPFLISTMADTSPALPCITLTLSPTPLATLASDPFLTLEYLT